MEPASPDANGRKPAPAQGQGTDAIARCAELLAACLHLAGVDVYRLEADGLLRCADTGTEWPGGQRAARRLLQTDLASLRWSDLLNSDEADLGPWAGGAPVRACAVERLCDAEGTTLGVLCAYDTAVRVLDREAERRLRGFSCLAASLLEQHLGALRHQVLQSDLARNRGLYEGIVKTAQEGIVTIDARGLIRSVNPACERIFECAASDLVGHNVSVLMPEPDHSAHDGYIGRYLREGQAHIINSERMVRGRRANGETFPMRLSVSEFFVDGARYFTGIIADVSALAWAEHKLQTSERLLRTILDNSDDSIFCKDREGRYLFANEGFARSIGCTMEQIVGQPASRLFPGALARDIDDYDRQVLESGQAVEYELSLPNRETGEQRIFLFTKTPLVNATGETYGLVASAHDITTRKAAEEALRLSEARYRGVIEDHPALLCRFLPDSTVTFANREYAGSWGRSPQTMEGAKLRQLLPLSDWNTLHEAMAALGPDSLTVTYEKKNWLHGRESWLRWTIRAILDEHRQIAEFQAVGFDVTALHLAQQSTELARVAADRANDAKSVFLSNMSHELRTPLNSVLGFAQMLEKNKREPLAPQQARCVAHILKSGELLLRLINEILDLSRIEAGAVAVQQEPVDLCECVRESFVLVQPQAEQFGVSVGVGEMPAQCLVRADATRCQQVLLNLLTNAVKYNRTGGEVEVSGAWQGDFFALSVRDTGEGIAEDKLRELFQPFNRLGAENSGIEGTGIGLTIARRLLHLMGGDIRVASRPGEGSTFTMLLPREQEGRRDQESAEPGSVARGSWQGCCVLYVEDSPTNQALMEMMLEQLGGLHLLLAGNGAEGLLIARSRQPDLILLDIGLPDMSGLEILAALKRDPRTADIPTCAVSAQAAPQEIERGLAAGFADYLTKPVHFERLVATLTRLLHSVPHETDR